MITPRSDRSTGVSGPNLRAQVKHPSNSSTVNRATPREPASQAGSIVPHSAHAAQRSHSYHKTVVEGSFVRPSATKMTRTEHNLNNLEDFSEKGHKL